MPGGGIEPPQDFWSLRILSPLRLPISPSRQIALSIETQRVGGSTENHCCYLRQESYLFNMAFWKSVSASVSHSR